MILKENMSFLIVGIVRDAENTLKGDVQKIKDSLGKTKNMYWFFVESDSSDGTLEILKGLKIKDSNFNFTSLGSLSDKLKKRTERLAFCRNVYVGEIIKSFNEVDFVIVADLDDLNNKLTPKAVDSCFIRDDWDMLSANQNGPYYDLWALRHKFWCPTDCWDTYAFFSSYVKNEETNMQNQIYSKMIKIPENSDWIEVDSAFGGFAIYKRRVFDIANYKGLTDVGNEICEHIHFHKLLKSNGCKLFINPQLINADFTDMTLAMKTKYRYRRKVKNLLLRLSPKFFRKFMFKT